MKKTYAVAIGVSALAAGVVLFLRACTPPLIAFDLHCKTLYNCNDAGAELTNRLVEKFPVGTRENILVDYLSSQGFHRRREAVSKCLPYGETPTIGVPFINCPPWDPDWNPENELSFEWSTNPACGSQVGAVWSTDKQKRITHLQGWYDVTCL